MAYPARRHVVRWFALVAAVFVIGGSGWAQRSTASAPAAGNPSAPPPAVAMLPPGSGGAALRSALAALPDLRAEDRTILSFVDHAAVRAGGAAVIGWSGLLLEVGVVGMGYALEAAELEAATGLTLADVANTLVVDAAVPRFLTLVRGRLDADRIDAALTARGYGPVADDRGRLWCGPLGCEDGRRMNMANRDIAFALFGGIYGQALPAALAGDLLAVGLEPAALDATLAAAAGAAPSLLARPEVAALVAALDIDATVRQVWMPLGEAAAPLAPPAARSIAFADVRRGGDEWALIAVAFEGAADADAFATGALEALGLAGDAAFAAATLQATLRAAASDAVVDRVAVHGLEVVRIVVLRPFPDGVGSPEDRPAALLGAVLIGAMRVELPWAGW